MRRCWGIRVLAGSCMRCARSLGFAFASHDIEPAAIPEHSSGGDASSIAQAASAAALDASEANCSRIGEVVTRTLWQPILVVVVHVPPHGQNASLSGGLRLSVRFCFVLGAVCAGREKRGGAVCPSISRQRSAADILGGRKAKCAGRFGQVLFGS